MTKEELDAIRKRAEAATKGNPLKDFSVLAKSNRVIIEDVPALLAEVERLRGVQKRLSNGYVSLFVNYLELLDDVIPDWREVLADDVKNLSEALRND